MNVAMNIKKSMRNLLIVAVLLGVGRHAFYLHQQHEHNRFLASHLTKQLEPTFKARSTSSDYYDYERMLQLLTQLREIKSAYHAKFTEEDGEVKHHLDIKEIKNILADFYREKERFERYVVRVKYFYKGEVPRKRAYCLRDHQKTLEKATRDLERMLRSL
jgi:hypothetical protein